MRFQIFHLHLLCCCPPSKYMSWPKRRAGQKQKQAVLLVASWKTCQVAQTDCQKMFHLYCRCYQNIQKSNNPSSWSERGKPIHGNCARHSSWLNERSGDHITEGLLKMWDLPIHGIPKRKKKNTSRRWNVGLDGKSYRISHQLFSTVFANPTSRHLFFGRRDFAHSVMMSKFRLSNLKVFQDRDPFIAKSIRIGKASHHHSSTRVTPVKRFLNG